MREVTMAYSLLPESPGRFVDPWLLARDLLLDYVFTENVEILLTEQIFNTNGSGGRYVVKTCPHSPSSPCTGHYAHFTGLSRHILSEQLSSPEMETLQSITLQLGIALEIRGSHIKASNCPSPTPWVPELEAHMALQIDSDPSTRNMARLNALVLKEFLKLCSVTQKQEKIPGSGQMFTFFWASTIVSHELLIGTLNSLDDDTIHGLAAQDHQVLSSKSQDTASPSSSLLFAMYRRVFFVLDPEVPIRTIPPALFFLKFNRWPYALHTYIDFLCNKSERLDLRETFLDFVEFLLRPGKPKQQRDTGYMLSQLLLVMTNGDISVPELSRFIIIASDVITQENLKRAQIDIYDIVKRDSLRFLHLQSFLMKQKAELESRVYGTQGPSPLDHASLLKQILETSSIGPMSQFPATQDKASLLKTSTSRNPLLIDLIHETPSLILDIRQATTKTLTGLWLEVMLTLPFENFQTYLKEVILFAYPTDKQTNLDFVLFEMTKTGALYTTTLMGLIFDLFRVQKTYEKEKSPASALFKFLGETEASKLVIDGLSYDSSALILTILRDAAVSDQTNSHLISDFLLDALAASKQAALDRFLQDLAVAVTKLTPCPYIPILQHVSLKSTSSPNALKIADTFCQSYLFESDGSNVLSDSGFQEQGVVRELVIRFMSNVTRRQMMNDFVERVLSGTGSLQKSEKLWKVTLSTQG